MPTGGSTISDMSADKMTYQDVVLASRASDRGSGVRKKTRVPSSRGVERNGSPSKSKSNEWFDRSRTKQEVQLCAPSPISPPSSAATCKLSRFKLHRLILFALLTQLIIAHNHYSTNHCLSIGHENTGECWILIQELN